MEILDGVNQWIPNPEKNCHALSHLMIRNRSGIAEGQSHTENIKIGPDCFAAIEFFRCIFVSD
jgi:hypothetical protein